MSIFKRKNKGGIVPPRPFIKGTNPATRLPTETNRPPGFIRVGERGPETYTQKEAIKPRITGNLVALKCTQCGAPMGTPYECEYCGTRYAGHKNSQATDYEKSRLVMGYPPNNNPMDWILITGEKAVYDSDKTYTYLENQRTGERKYL